MSAGRKRQRRSFAAEQGEHESHERWLVSYADFITLLFAFFTILYATSQQDAAKEKKFENSIRASFVLMGAGAGSGHDEASGRESLRASLREDSASGAFPRQGAGPGEVQDYVERRAREDLSQEQARKVIGGIRHDAIGVRIQLASSALFAPGSADLLPESRPALEKIGRLLKDSDRRIIVEGHTDDEPIHTARFPTNWELSASRATKIVRYLAQAHSIEANRMTAVAYADQKPVAPNDSDENRARNRRIELLIVTGDGPTE